MAAGVHAQWYVDLSIAGTPLAITPHNTPQLDIIQTIHQSLPSIYIKHRDPTGDNSELFRFKDSDPISISIGVPGIHVYEGLNFMVIGSPRGNPVDPKDGVLIQGVYNSAGWLRKIVDKHHDGNSHEVFSTLASQVGLKPVVDSASDFMTWLPNRTPFSAYARFITDRAYASNTSCFISCVSDTGTAYFKDVDRVIQSGITKIFSQFYEPGSINVLTYEVPSKSHVTNNSRGYGATTMSMKNDGSIVELNKIDLRGFASALPFGEAIVGAIGDLGNRILQLPLLPGNTHDKWSEAIHQNMRIKSMYGFDVAIVTDTPAQVNLMDKVGFRPMNRQTGQPVEALTGEYIVTAITKTLSGGRYYEKITLTNQGPSG